MITIGFLADHLDTIPVLANWFRQQWPDYFADWSQAEMEQDFLQDAAYNRLPCRLVAFKSGDLAGTIVLRQQGSESLPEFQPELGGLYVTESQRGQGVGTALVHAGMQLALDLGYKKVYATTVAASGILERAGWEYIKTVTHQDGQLALYGCNI